MYSRWLVLGLFALLTLSNKPLLTTAEQTFVFGISLALDPPPGQSFANVQPESYNGLMLWRDWWNAKPASERLMKNGEPFLVELHVERMSNFTDVPENRQALFDVYRDMKLNTSIHHLIMPIATPWDIPLRNYSYYELGVEYMLAIADSSEAYYSTPGSYGSVTANILTMTSYLPYLRVAKASTVAVIKANEVFQLELCQGVTSQADLNSLNVVIDNTILPDEWFDYNTFGAVDRPERKVAWDSVLDAAIAANVDALFICDYGPGSEYAVQYLKDKNWTPKSLTISSIFNQWADPSNFDFLTTTTSFDRQARFPAQPGIGTCEDYSQKYEARFGTPVSSFAARATLAGMIYSQAIQNAKGNSTDEINTALATGQLKSFMGTSAFDTSSRQTLASLAVQLLNNNTKVNVIGPAQAAVEQLIYPIPTWKERIFDPKWGHGTEIAAAVLMGIGGLVTIGWLIFLFIHWNHKVIRAASPLFLLAILIGSLIVYISIFNWMPNLANDSICNLRAWLLPLGFMTMFGALLAKTHRIHRLYNSKGINILVIRNIQVALITLVIVVGQAVLSVLMITVTKLKSEVKVIDQYRISHNYRVCTFSTALKVLFGLNVGYAFGLLIWGSYLAYQIRKVPISIYDESKVIAFSIYNTCFFGIIVIVIQLAIGNSNRFLTFMITAVCCFLGAMVTTGCLFGAKLWALYRPSVLKMSTTTGGTAHTSSSGDSHSAKPYSMASIHRDHTPAPAASGNYKKKYKEVKQIVKDLKERIRQLESLAKSNGFLEAAEEAGSAEMQEKVAPKAKNGSTPTRGKSADAAPAEPKSKRGSRPQQFTPKAPVNDEMDTSSSSSSTDE